MTASEEKEAFVPEITSIRDLLSEIAKKLPGYCLYCQEIFDQFSLEPNALDIIGNETIDKVTDKERQQLIGSKAEQFCVIHRTFHSSNWNQMSESNNQPF